MSAVQVTRRDILRLVARHEWDTLRRLLATMSPEEHGETYYVGLVHLQYPDWSSGYLNGPARALRTILRRSRDHYVLSMAYVHLGHILEFSGDARSAEQCFRDSCSYADDPLLVANAMNCMGLLYFNLELFSKSEEAYAEANRLGRNEFVSIYSKTGMARCTLRAGRLDRARRWMAMASETISRNAVRQTTDQEVVLGIVEGELLAKEGDLARAALAFDNAELRATVSERGRSVLRASEARAQVFIEHRLPQAQEALAKFHAQAVQTGYRQYVDRARRLRVQLAEYSGAKLDELWGLCQSIQNPAQRFIAVASLGRDELVSIELGRLACNLSNEMLQELRAVSLA